MSEISRVYLDFSAATPVDERVLAAMEPYWRRVYGNAGALHEEGRQAKAAIEEARKVCASEIGASPDEVVFTSGGTEANNLAIFGLVKALEASGKKCADMHVITSSIEHSSILDCINELEAAGVAVTRLPVGTEGIVSPEDVRQAIRENTVLVSVMYVNSEIGTIMPLKEISREIRRASEGGNGIFFHSDASQAPSLIPCEVKSLGVDLLSLDGQKVYGPKGVGCLYVRRSVKIRPIMFGGNQERGLRPGTPVTPLIVGFAKALEICGEEREGEAKRVAEIRDFLIDKVLEEFPGAVLNGSRDARLPSNINVSIPGCDGEYLVLALDAKGFAISTRSACLFGEEPGSRVVKALHEDKEGQWRAQAAIRISIGRPTTRKDAECLLAALREVVLSAKEPSTAAVITTVEE